MNEATPLRVLIVDDEAPARNRLRDLLADCAESVPVEVAAEAATGREALDAAAVHAVDVVLLDIRMPGMDGIEVARHLGGMERPPAIVFTTAYDDYAIKAFEVHATDYLLKPIRAARLAEALGRVPRNRPAPPPEALLQELRPEARTHLSAHERGRIHLIPLDDVVCLKAELKYVTVRTAERDYLVEESLTRLEQEFADRFLRIHRNCLIARAAIRGFERVADGAEGHWVAVLAGCDERLVVSRRHNHVVREFAR